MENENDYKSRTERKKEAEKLQKLGLKLTKLTIQQLERIEIPQDLRKALVEGKNITSNIAGKRHRQYIGALMRDVNPSVIHRALLEAEEESPDGSGEKSDSLLWVERLLMGNLDDIETLLSEYPGLERQRLKQLIRNIRKAKPGPKFIKARKALEQLIMNEIIT